MSTIRQSFATVGRRLAPILGNGEAEAAARIIFEDICGYSRTFIFANGDREMTAFMQQRVDAAADKVAMGMPVQYAVGKALFMGNMFTVNPSVLIPRPETAGLVDMITDRWHQQRDLDILDIGTGSGCIAITVAKALPFSNVTGLDISPDAIAVANANAKSLGVHATFVADNILTSAPPSAPLYDIIVSNPPYVCRSEQESMEPHVLSYEPHAALFVPDDDPLLFYRAITTYARKALRSKGMLYLEINSRLPQQIRQILTVAGFDNVEILRDYLGNYRYAIATQP